MCPYSSYLASFDQPFLFGWTIKIGYVDFVIFKPVNSVADVIEVKGRWNDRLVAGSCNLRCCWPLFGINRSGKAEKIETTYVKSLLLPIIYPAFPNIDDGFATDQVTVIKYFLPHWKEIYKSLHISAVK